MTDFLFDLITHNGYLHIPKFNSQKELEEYFGENIPAKFDDRDSINAYIDKWGDIHKFGIIDEKVLDYDLIKRYEIRKVIYTIDNEYYKLFYYSDPYNGCLLEKGPIKVYPVTSQITITEYVEE